MDASRHLPIPLHCWRTTAGAKATRRQSHGKIPYYFAHLVGDLRSMIVKSLFALIIPGAIISTISLSLRTISMSLPSRDARNNNVNISTELVSTVSSSL